MGTDDKVDRDGYSPELRSLVIAEAKRVSIGGAMERYGVPYATVRMWMAEEKTDVEAVEEAPDRRTWRVHSAEEKAAALADVETMSTEDTAEKHEITPQTLRAWRREAESEDQDAVGSEEGQVEGAEVESVDPNEWALVTAKRAAHGKRFSPAQKADAVANVKTMGVSEAARQAGVSRSVLYQWIRRAHQATGEPLPEPRWEQTEEQRQRDLEILHEWHKQPGLGPMQIRGQLRRRGVKTSVHTVRRVMEDSGYRPPKVESHAHHERYEAVRPNQLWHLDFVHRHIHRAGTFTLILLDDHSRFVTGHAVSDAERADTVIETFEEAVMRHGRPEAVMTDRGSAFWAWRGVARFTRLLEELGVDQIVAEDKELNGKVEVFNANLAKELFNEKRFDDVGRMRAALAKHLRWYNHDRTHQGLGGILVPADRYYGRAEEVMARIEAGQPEAPDPHDPGLDARTLSLFQVVSRGGSPEVWLLGQRIL